MSKSKNFVILLSIVLFFLNSCSENGSSNKSNAADLSQNSIGLGSAIISINTRDKELAKSKSMDLAYIVLLIYTPDTLIQTTISVSSKEKTISSIPEGLDIIFSVQAFSQDSILYKQGEAYADIFAGETASVQITVEDIYASLHIGIGAVPDNVDSVFAQISGLDIDSIFLPLSIEANIGEYNDSVFTTADYIPIGESRQLNIFFLSNIGETLYVAAADLQIGNDDNIFGVWHLDIQQYTPSYAKVSLELNDEGDGYIYASFLDVKEDGDLIITEIRYKGSTGSDSDYVEIYNNSDIIVSTDSLSLFYGGVDAGIPPGFLLSPGSLFVISRGNLDYSDCVAENNLNLPATSKLLELKSQSGRLIDKVEYESGGDWPSSKTGTAIILKTTLIDKKKNNYGQSWDNAEILIPGTQDFGSPGIL